MFVQNHHTVHQHKCVKIGSQGNGTTVANPLACKSGFAVENNVLLLLMELHME